MECLSLFCLLADWSSELEANLREKQQRSRLRESRGSSPDKALQEIKKLKEVGPSCWQPLLVVRSLLIL